MAGIYQEAAVPNEEATPLIMLNPGKTEAVISHMSHWTTKYGCAFNIQTAFRHVGIQRCVSFQSTQLSPCLPESESMWLERDKTLF